MIQRSKRVKLQANDQLKEMDCREEEEENKEWEGEGEE